MKVNTHFDRDKGTFILPNIVLGYNNEDKVICFIVFFACWAFAIEICFK